MEKQRREESSFQQPPWIPQTPMKPFSPICPYTVEDQYHSSQVEERFVLFCSKVEKFQRVVMGNWLSKVLMHAGDLLGTRI